MHEAASDDDYRIAIFDRPKTPHELSSVFRELLPVHPIDAIVWSNHVPGILNERFSASQAQAVVSAIKAKGLEALSIRQSDIPNLHQSLSVHNLELDDRELRVVDIYGNPQASIPWSAVKMICVGEVPCEVSRRDPSGDWSGLSAGRHYQRPEIHVPLSPTFEVWIICAMPHPHLHFHHERMSYEYLGTRLTGSSTVNFHQFVVDVQARATHATLPESTRSYLQHNQTEHYRFKSSEALFNYATLQSLRCQLQAEHGSTQQTDDSTPTSRTPISIATSSAPQDSQSS